MQKTDTAFTRRQSLNATVHRRCDSCGAPGVFHDVEGVNPGCYDPLRKDQPVGDVCPNCGAKRPKPEDRGEIWSRVIRPKIWPIAKAAIFDAGNLLRRRLKRR